MNEFKSVAKTSDFLDTDKLCLEVDDRFVVLIHLHGEYFCVDDVCTHDGGTLGDGELLNGCLVCPRHGAQFDVKTGEARKMPATEPTVTHAVKVDGTDILVQLS